MNRFSRDSDNQYSVRQNEEYDTYNQPRTDNRLFNRQNYDRNNQNSYYTYERQRPDDNYSTGERRVRISHHEDERERVDPPPKTQSRIIVDNNQEINRRTNPPDQTQRSPKVDYTVHQIKQTTSRHPRSIVIDINISVNFDGRNPQISTSTSNIRPRSPPIRSTAIIDDVGYIDLDIRSPERTARLATDGLIRSPPSKISTNLPNENRK